MVFAINEAFQFDWSEDWAILGGEHVKLQVVHTKLSHSRVFILRADLPQTREVLFDALSQVFLILGGVLWCRRRAGSSGSPCGPSPIAYPFLSAGLPRQSSR